MYMFCDLHFIASDSFSHQYSHYRWICQRCDITQVIDRKGEFLSRHVSQKDWLDKSQGLDSYIISMREMSREIGRGSGRFEFAEGWRRHLHLGYSARDIDPLGELLGPLCAPAATG